MGGRSFKQQGRVIWPGFNSVPQRHSVKVGRNDPCPCGSGKKFKECHERKGEHYLQKLTLEKDKERLQEIRERRREGSLPWYKRLFRRS
jgi:hypothetical protein